MPTPRLPTIRQDTPVLPLPRRLRRWFATIMRDLAPVIVASAAACDANRYRKHFWATTHVQILLLHRLLGSPSLRQTYALLAACPELLGQPPNTAPPVSFSDLADSSTTRPAALLAGLLPTLLQWAHRQRGRQDLPPTLRLLDATFFPLSQRHAAWLPISRGVQLQVLYAPAAQLPEWVELPENVCSTDCQALDLALLSHPDRLTALCGTTLVFDLGYYSHTRFDQLLAAGIHLVTRYGQKARYEVLDERPVQQPLWDQGGGRITVQADQRIRLGSPNNRTTPHLLELRMVTAEVHPTPKAAAQGKQVQQYVLLTDRWDLTAHEVVQTYLWRWEIELFFRWLKRTIGAIPVLGYSRNAVTMSIYLALVVHLLTLLASRAMGFDRASVLVRSLLPGLLLVLAGSAASGGAPPPLATLAVPDG